MHHSTNAPAAIAQHLIIRGHVQGVGYRWSMVQAAQQCGVQGWVRNRRDGSVEALVTGAADAVQSVIHWAHKGPPHARVDAVEVRSVPSTEVSACSDSSSGFVQRETEG